MAFSAPDRIAELEYEVELLRHRIDGLLGAELAPPEDMGGAKFRVTHLIARQSPLATSMNALVHAITEHELDLSRPTNNVKVHISRARKVLARHGIEIETVRGIGYRMTPESKAKWQALVESANQQEAAA
jgi:DNA-binding response OmpR family regulator